MNSRSSQTISAAMSSAVRGLLAPSACRAPSQVSADAIHVRNTPAALDCLRSFSRLHSRRNASSSARTLGVRRRGSSSDCTKPCSAIIR